MRTRNAKIAFGALAVVVVWYAVMFFDRSFSRGDDFMVFFRVAQRFWDGVRPYDRFTYGNMVFKYPPWILPFFLPFGLVDLTTAKILWGAVESVSLYAIVLRLHQGFAGFPPVRPWVQALFLVALFELFGNHASTGQITIVVLALALWTDPLRASFVRFFLLTTAFSAKITSFFPMVFALGRRSLWRSVLGTAVIFAALSWPIYHVSYDDHFAEMRREWTTAMFSGTADMNNVRIGFTTREVQGLPSLLLRKGGLDEHQSKHVLFATLFSALLVGGVWAWFARRLVPSAQWIGWLALLPAVQPLAWFHTFIFAYPLLAIGAERALRDTSPEGRRRFAGFLVCTLLIGAVTVKTMGAVGAELEFWSVKLWGTLGATILFWKIAPKDSRR